MMLQSIRVRYEQIRIRKTVSTAAHLWSSNQLDMMEGVTDLHRIEILGSKMRLVTSGTEHLQLETEPSWFLKSSHNILFQCWLDSFHRYSRSFLSFVLLDVPTLTVS